MEWARAVQGFHDMQTMFKTGQSRFAHDKGDEGSLTTLASRRVADYCRSIAGNDTSTAAIRPTAKRTEIQSIRVEAMATDGSGEHHSRAAFSQKRISGQYWLRECGR